jgi:prepilin-type N-terminal cleavage/methylation domain-containing protein
MRAHREAGFTMIEIMIVVALIVAMLAVLVPNLGGDFGRGLSNATDVLAAELRYASQRAVATGRVHHWVVDLEEETSGERFRLEQQLESESPEVFETPTHAELLELKPPTREIAFGPVKSRVGTWRWLGEEGVWIDSVVVGEEEFTRGLVEIAFAGDGGADPAEILLSDEHGRMTLIRVLPFTSEIRVVEDADEL